MTVVNFIRGPVAQAAAAPVHVHHGGVVWLAGRSPEGPKSAFALISSALPPAGDIPGAVADFAC